MKIVAYAARRYAGATRKALGGQATLLTCPPTHDGNVDSKAFAGQDLVVFNLHGLLGTSAWFGGDGEDDGIPALKSETLKRFKLNGAGVFAINCYLGDDKAPMREALEKAGAAWVVAGEGANFGGLDVPAGADVLLKWFANALTINPKLSPETALASSKLAVQLFAPRRTPQERMVLADTLKFKVWRLA